MKIAITRDKLKTANYICFVAKNITRGFFQENSYYVLPYHSNNLRCVYFPDLNYSKNFWEKIKKTKSKDLTDEFPSECVNEIFSKLKSNSKPKIQIKYQGLVKKYQRHLNNISEIEILETEYGTIGSFMVKSNNIYLTQRYGNTGDNFERTLLLAISKYKNKDIGELGSMVWHKRIAIIEFLLGKTKPKVNQKVINDSNAYLKKLGHETKIDLSQVSLEKFTVQEKNVFNTLTRHKGEIVSFETLANVLWKQKADEKYSLQAIAKVIENLRKKIKLQGINKELIHTRRGFGYWLKN